MRTYTLFRLSSGLLATQAAVRGPAGIARPKLVVDTGAIRTVMHPGFLERTLQLPVFTVKRFNVFGTTFDQYPILAYAPAAFTSGIDGVLSIDILRLLSARLDFSSGVLSIP